MLFLVAPDSWVTDCHRLVSAAASANRVSYTRPAEALGDVVALLGFRVRLGPVDGYGCLEPKARTIWLSDRLASLLDSPSTVEQVARFTVAHELAHLRLHSRFLSRLTNYHERQAEQYAAEFLIPASMLSQRISGQITPELIRRLSAWFMVSQAAMRVRLIRLGYQIGRAA